MAIRLRVAEVPPRTIDAVAGLAVRYRRERSVLPDGCSYRASASTLPGISPPSRDTARNRGTRGPQASGHPECVRRRRAPVALLQTQAAPGPLGRTRLPGRRPRGSCSMTRSRSACGRRRMQLAHTGSGSRSEARDRAPRGEQGSRPSPRGGSGVVVREEAFHPHEMAVTMISGGNCAFARAAVPGLDGLDEGGSVSATPLVESADKASADNRTAAVGRIGEFLHQPESNRRYSVNFHFRVLATRNPTR